MDRTARRVPERRTTRDSDEGLLLLTRVGLTTALLVLVALCCWYCSSVYFDAAARLIQPARCVDRGLRSEASTAFWIDRLALVGAVRAGSLLFWDDGVDLSFVSDGPPASAEQALSRVAAGCDLRLHALANDTTYGTGVWRLSDAAGACFYLRRCARTLDAALSCPAMHGADAVDLLRLDDVFPVAPCTVSGVATNCPRHVHALLRGEFGEHWRTAHLFTLLERSR